MSGDRRKGKSKYILGKALASIILVALIAFTVLAVQNKDSILRMVGDDTIDSTATATTDTEETEELRKPFTRNSNGCIWK